MRNRGFLYVIAVVMIAIVAGSILLRQVNNSSLPSKTTFDGEQAYRDVLAQLGFGPRITGTEGNRKCAEYLIERHAYRIFGLIHSADSKKTCSL